MAATTKLEGVPERLHLARKRAAITPYMLDKLAGLTAGHCAAIERGTRANMEIRTAARIVRVLGISLDWLVLGAGELATDTVIRVAVAEAMVRRDASRAA